MRNIIIMMTCN